MNVKKKMHAEDFLPLSRGALSAPKRRELKMFWRNNAFTGPVHAPFKHADGFQCPQTRPEGIHACPKVANQYTINPTNAARAIE